MRHPVTRFLLAALAAVLGASLLIGTAFAKGPVPENPPGVEGSEWPPLPEIKVETFETVTEYPDTELPIGMLASSAGGGCKTQTVDSYIRQKTNGQWSDVVKVRSETDFCYNGSVLVSPGPDFDANYWIYVSSWENTSWKEREWGGTGDWEHEDQTTAKFRQCSLFCGNTTTIFIRKEQFGDGTTIKYS